MAAAYYKKKIREYLDKLPQEAFVTTDIILGELEE